MVAAGVVAAAALIAGATNVAAGGLVAGTERALDRITDAVDAAESSHGADPGMWRLPADGPQGPMQVSAAAATDVGGGDRFDINENRELGRAYLARLYRHYANWPDAIAADKWGPGHMDAWIGAGRPIDRFPLSVALYRIRVLFGSPPFGPWHGRYIGIVHPPARRSLADRRHPSRQSVAVERLYGVLMAASADPAR